MTAALGGVRVLDLTRYIPGPYCTMLLGDLGAEVVKVEEPPIGDPTRALPPAVGADSALHAALNRNKRSIAVDIRRKDGAEVVGRLAERADVFIEAFCPGALAKRGLGSDALQARNPRLVYCSLTGYGPEGALASRAGHDINYAARSGFLGENRDAEGRPVMPAAQVADMTGGLLATVGVLAALQARERTGRGQVVDVSLLQAALALMTVPATRLLAGGSADELGGSYACYGTYRCADGRYVAVGALEPKFWEALCRALGAQELVGRQWEGKARRRETIEVLAARFASRDRDDWVRTLEAADCCVDPVLDLAEACGEAEAGGAVHQQTSGDARFRTLAPPVRLRSTPASVRRQAPAFGAHTDEVLGEAGISAAEIGRMRAEGVLA